MTVYDIATDKIQKLPEPLAQEVADFVDFLLIKSNRTKWQLLTQFADSLEIAESDFSDYLPGLKNYEEALARGEIQW
ncbi:MAG: DUF2281 domain-containing protein [bacterium]